MNLVKDDDYKRKERKFFKKRPHYLIDKYGLVLEKLKTNPFDPSLKTYKLKGDLSEFYACIAT